MWSVVTLSPSSAIARAPVIRPKPAARLGGHAVEVRRALDVGRLRIPGVAVAGRDLEAVPVLVAGEHLAVAAAEHVRLDRLLDRVGHLALRRPDVGQAHVALQRLAREVDVHPARQRVGHARAAGWRGSSS